jgi:ribonuclease HI
LEILVNDIKCSFFEHQKLPKLKSKRIISGLPMTDFLVKGFFDGVSQRGFCGAGFVLQLNHLRYFIGWMVRGVGMNTKVEMLGLWTLLTLDLKLGMGCFHVFGDSQVVINWILGKGEIRSIAHQHWGQRILDCLDAFDKIGFSHIYRELNIEADKMSKRALTSSPGIYYYKELKDGEVVSRDHIDLF